MADEINNRTHGCVLHFACPCECNNKPKDCVSKIIQWLESEVEE